MESFLTFYPGKELRAALDQRELEACVVQWAVSYTHLDVYKRQLKP